MADASPIPALAAPAVLAAAEKLSAQEAEIYDRQIRLWGVESQQRMQSSRVLLAGAFRGVMAEVG